jgi:hypothetical protein
VRIVALNTELIVFQTMKREFQGAPHQAAAQGKRRMRCARWGDYV